MHTTAVGFGLSKGDQHTRKERRPFSRGWMCEEGVSGCKSSRLVAPQQTTSGAVACSGACLIDIMVASTSNDSKGLQSNSGDVLILRGWRRFDELKAWYKMVYFHDMFCSLNKRLR